MNYNSVDEIKLNCSGLYRDKGVDVKAVEKEEVTVSEYWHGLMEHTGRIVTVTNHRDWLHARDSWILIENAPQEVQDFFFGGEELGVEGVKKAEGIINHKNALLVVSAYIKVKLTIPCNKVELFYSLEYDNADWSETLRFPVSDKDIDNAIERLHYAAEDWMIENGITEEDD